jgi:murein L,D-transpeptidase YcbB/YkuD
MHKTLLLALAGLAIAFPTTAGAADGRGMFAVKGIGTVNCQRYLDARAKGDREYVLFAGYLTGYITAYNQLAPATFDVVSWQSVDTLLGMMASYCNKNPQDNLAVATTRLITALTPDKLEAASETVEARAEQGSTKLYRETLQRVQQRLAQLGHYSGPADGQFTPATQRALEKFQSEKGIKKTGLPDQATLFELLLTRSATK